MLFWNGGYKSSTIAPVFKIVGVRPTLVIGALHGDDAAVYAPNGGARQIALPFIVADHADINRFGTNFRVNDFKFDGAVLHSNFFGDDRRAHLRRAFRFDKPRAAAAILDSDATREGGQGKSSHGEAIVVEHE